MGYATAMHFARLGATVFCLDVNQANAEKTAAACQGKAIIADITDDAQLTAAFEKMPNLRAVVHAAGVLDAARAVGKAGPQPLARFQKTININLSGTFNVLRLAAATMMSLSPLNQDGERGVIITTASIAAFDGQIGQLAYSASKGGVAAMTLPAAREFGPFGIRVMTIAPGIIETPMMAALPDKVSESLKAQTPFPKRLGDPDEFAALAQHIIENPYLNGSTIRLDAGIRMAAQ